MRNRSVGWITAVVIVAALALITRDFRRPTPNAPGTFSFAVFGDAPYYWWEEPRFRLVLRDFDTHDLAWVLHVGDIFWHPCTDENYRRILGHLDSLRHPVIYTPGDNETFDCWEAGSGGFSPQERFARVRKIFFSHPARSLGRTAMPLVSQGGEFVENARWSRGEVVFATVDMIGTKNGMGSFPGRTSADDAASRRRTQAAAMGIRDAFAEAKRTNAAAVVIGFHANPEFEESPTNEHRLAYEPFIATLEEETERFARPVLLVHGDGHEYKVDHPLVRRTTGQRLLNLTRMQVPGSGDVGWVRVIVQPGRRYAFAFEEHVVPGWKLW